MSVVPSAIPPFTVEPRRQIYLGMDPNDGFRRCWASPLDSAGVIGPPRFGKSSGVVIPTLLTWDGPVVATSSRVDLIRFTKHWRNRLAAQRGGQVYIYDPFGNVPDESTVRWSPLAGCEDPSICWRRAVEMTKTLARIGGDQGGLLRAGVTAVLRGLFHAAALSNGTMDDVWRWLNTWNLEPAVTILRNAATLSQDWADSLQGFGTELEFERRVRSAACTCLDATAHPRVRASTREPDLDIDRLLRTGSTLYIVVPTRTDQVAPLLLGLIDSIKQQATAIAGQSLGGRLDPPLLLALDDMPEVVPNPALPSQISDGGKSGFVTLWTAQSFAQLRQRLGEDGQQALLAATTVKIVFGGISSRGDLNDVSEWAGRLNRREKMLPPEAVQMLPPFYAWLFHQGSEPLLVETRPAELLDPYNRLASAKQLS